MTRREALKVLGLPQQFDEKQLKSAYRSRSMVAHPDKGGSAEAFLRVSEAYDLLREKQPGATNADFGRDKRFHPKFQEGMSAEERARMQAQMEEARAEAMHRAEEMLYSVFDELLQSEENVLIAFVERAFGPTYNPAKWLLKRSLKSLASMVQPFIAQVMESEGSTVTINGKTMSGKAAFKAFQDWKEKLKVRIDQRRGAAEPSASDDRRSRFPEL